MRVPSYAVLWRKLRSRRLYPHSRLARFTTYILAVALLLYLLHRLVRLVVPSASSSLGPWITLLTVSGAVLTLVWVLRWVRRDLMWRLRNRLIVTYVFIGVIPLLLLASIFGIAAYIFAGQFSTFIVTTRMTSELRNLETANSAIARELSAALARGELPSVALKQPMAQSHAEANRNVSAWLNHEPIPVNQRNVEPSQPPTFLQNGFHDVVRDGGKLYLRAAAVLPVGPKRLTVISGEPLDKNLLENWSAGLGEITVYGSGVDVGVGPEAGNPSKSSPTRPAESAPRQSRRSGITAGTTRAASHPFDRSLRFATVMFFTDWQSGTKNAAAVVTVRTRLSQLYAQLFETLGRWGDWAGIVLGLVAIVFALIEILALFIGLRLTRTMTRSVAALYVATQHVNRGNFGHRIPVMSHDQLANLESSFNSMTDSIQRLLAEQKEKQRMENELVIAQEVQAQLFPKKVSDLEGLEVHGFCRPARTVSGDYYDFVRQPPDRLTIAVGDVSGKGISAALLMATIHSAVRAYSLQAKPALVGPVSLGAAANHASEDWSSGTAEISPARLISLLNKQLYASTPPEKYATLFLSTYDDCSRTLTYTNAGHLPPVIIGRDGVLRRLDCGGTVVGLFERPQYEESAIELREGDIFLAFSDGVTEPENDFGEFGEKRLIELVQENRYQPLSRISETVTVAVEDWIGGNEQPDDVTLVLARAR